MRRIIIVIGVIILALVVLSVTAWADNNPPTGIKVNDNTLVPIRYIAEWLGATVTFDVIDASTNNITLQTATTKMLLTTNSTTASIDGNDSTLQSPAIERDSITYVPLRFVAEGFHAGVDWDEAKQQATISNPNTGKTLTIDVSPSDHAPPPNNASETAHTGKAVPPVSAIESGYIYTGKDGKTHFTREIPGGAPLGGYPSIVIKGGTTYIAGERRVSSAHRSHGRGKVHHPHRRQT